MGTSHSKNAHHTKQQAVCEMAPTQNQTNNHIQTVYGISSICMGVYNSTEKLKRLENFVSVNVKQRKLSLSLSHFLSMHHK